MTDSSNENKNPAATEGTKEGQPTFSVRGQYIKDLSFESPQSPANLLPQKEQPKIDINVDLNAGKLGDNMYESAIKVTVNATVGDKPFFLVELSYGGLFAIENVPEDKIEQMLFIDCPFVLFPFARRVISDVTRDGGFPPLMMEPIDFHTLYARRKQAEAA